MRFESLLAGLSLTAVSNARSPSLYTRDNGGTCTVRANGVNDTDAFETAVKQCGIGGTISMPDRVYNISRPLALYLENAVLDLHGYLTYTPDVDYWVANHIPFNFQNQSIGMTFSGSNFTLNGNGQGGMDGNGQVWYNHFTTHGNAYGRPIPWALVNATDAVVTGWNVIQPQFWAGVIIESSNVLMRNYYTNATSYNESSTSSSVRWLQNTDGIDFYRSNNITIDGMVVQNGDDCIGLKGNSTQITLRNVTCYGGLGIAFGSVGQYPGVTDIIEDVLITDSNFYPSRQMGIGQAVYFKSWIGTYFGTPPNGGGGGQGYCRNVTLSNIHSMNATFPISVQTTLSYSAHVPDSAKTQSMFSWDSVTVSNWTGTAKANRLINFSCSENLPCRGWLFSDFNLKPGLDTVPEVNYICNNMIINGTSGLDGCHPSNRTHGGL